MQKPLYSIRLTRTELSHYRLKWDTLHTIEVEPPLNHEHIELLNLFHDAINVPVKIETFRPGPVKTVPPIERPYTSFAYSGMEDAKVIDLSERIAKFLRETCLADVAVGPDIVELNI